MRGVAELPGWKWQKRKRADEEGQAGPGAPFVTKPSGLYWRDLEGEASDLFLAGPFEILAETRDLDGCSWGLLLQWEDRDGRVKTWAMPKSLLAGDGVDVRRALLDRGLAIASGTKARNLLTNYLVSQRSDERARAVPTTGWHDGQFVFPDCSVGKADGERCFFQTEHSFAHNYNVRGTVQDWKENVARFAVGNSRLAFSISTSVAAILINACGIESGGFHFRGASSIGKSTALLAAGSVWGGGGRNGFLTSWRATSNALEGVAVTHNDALVCLDELSLVAARDASESAYMLANGSGKSRAARNGSLRKPAEWALLFLSSGEIGLAEKIAEDLRGRRETAGQEVRFVDIPADTGEHGLFENLHGFPSSQAFADHLRIMARESYGAAARAFIEAVASDLDAAAIKQGAKSFIKDHCPEGADFQVQRFRIRRRGRRACDRKRRSAMAGRRSGEGGQDMFRGMACGARRRRVSRNPQWNLRHPRFCFGTWNLALFSRLGASADEFSRGRHPRKNHQPRRLQKECRQRLGFLLHPWGLARGAHRPRSKGDREGSRRKRTART
jgi:putative DNA primase/helicase